ncbi:DNA-3-methyladenine glycosylase 2 family protein [Rhodococcus sp. ABRD24]|uniref:DNA-3-methyladenine glycosylase family protein n=1 Tax=Rhodococcus sp. ABRD24 TaxID=2507582 RepID=UPI00104031C6|nr:DNA-3-methyladenine glycosylase [Rhodococcus sp. ABRD24]QBJ96188.1 DNA-3-methyladenine glycosylase 2 family protein [Rhodococcus sp. ABRD24]
MTGTASDVHFEMVTRRPVDLASTLSPLRRGRFDPCHRVESDGTVWRTSLLPSGAVTYRLRQRGSNTVDVRVWGSGAEEFGAFAPGLVGEHDADAAGTFEPSHPKLVDAHRRYPNLRIVRTARVLESLVPAILEQRVHTEAAYTSWRRLVGKFGTPAPGPAPDGMRVPPPADVWRRIPSWEFHAANVDPRRAQTIVACARVADRLEEIVDLDRDAAHRRLRAVPGVGAWTAAEVAQRALGDADALSVGDFHLASIVGWTLLGRAIDDDAMVEYLADLRPHRYRAIRLLEISGHARKPKFGPRTPIVDHRWH